MYFRTFVHVYCTFEGTVRVHVRIRSPTICWLKKSWPSATKSFVGQFSTFRPARRLTAVYRISTKRYLLYSLGTLTAHVQDDDAWFSSLCCVAEETAKWRCDRPVSSCFPNRGCRQDREGLSFQVILISFRDDSFSFSIFSVSSNYMRSSFGSVCERLACTD